MPQMRVAGDSFVGVRSLLSMVANLGSNSMGRGAGADGGAVFAACVFFTMVIESRNVDSRQKQIENSRQRTGDRNQ
jgi:hypothetical protein